MITINKWSEAFENADTRKRQRLGWFLSPTGCDSKGFRLLMRKGERGVVALGVFQGLCQLMGTLSKEARKAGKFLNSDGSGMEVADLWEMTRMQVANPLEVIEDLKSVGWLSVEDEQVTEERATNVPPACHHHAASVPENSGFVKGEGEGEGEGKGKGKGTVAFAPDHYQTRLNALFNRRPTTKWSPKELKAYKSLEITEEDMALVEKFHNTPGTYHRQGLQTLLNNWLEEVDKARNYNPKGFQQAKENKLEEY